MRLAAVVLLLLVALGAARAEAGVSYRTLESGGLERSYRVYTPDGLDPARPVPVVLVFHGFGGTASQVARATGFDALAERERFLAVYPESVGPGWNVGDGCCGPAGRRGIDDVGFVDRLLGDVGARARVDPKRVYAVGHSNGGFFAYELACRRSARFAGIGAVAATMEQGGCRPRHPISIVHVHGLADPLVPFDGEGGVRPARDRASVPETIAFWRRANGCGAVSTARRGDVTRSVSRCRDGTAVELIAIRGQGHSWPDEAFAATPAVWQFLRAHPDGGE